MNPRRILVLQLKRIGDAILTAPAIAALREAYPQAEIVVVVPEAVAGLARSFSGVDRVLKYSNWSLNLHVWLSVMLGEWDLVLDFTGTDRSALMAWLSGAAERRGYAKFSSGKWRARAYTDLSAASVRDLHTVDFHLALTGLQEVQTPALQPPRVEVPALPERYALVHIGTAREEKFWPVERWAEVITRLHEVDRLPVVLTGTNAGLERPHLDKLRGMLHVPVTDLTGQLSLQQTAAVIGTSAIALGVDSMAMHLAAMFRKPQVVLFGPTNPHHWRPRHARALTLVAGQPEPVLETQPKVKGAAMELISTQQVFSAMDRLLSQSTS